MCDKGAEDRRKIHTEKEVETDTNRETHCPAKAKCDTTSVLSVNCGDAENLIFPIITELLDNMP